MGAFGPFFLMLSMASLADALEEYPCGHAISPRLAPTRGRARRTVTRDQPRVRALKLWRDLASLAYMLDRMLFRARILAAAALLGSLTACAPTLGPPPPGVSPAPSASAEFRAADFAWAQAPGRNTLAGRLAFKQGATPYSCVNASVILTPETSWSRRRMTVLYKSDTRSALPSDEVRARTSQAPPGDSGPYIKRTTCDAAGHFSFTGLPDGSWFVVTIAKPAAGGQGVSMAFMRRVTTRGGRVTNFDL